MQKLMQKHPVCLCAILLLMSTNNLAQTATLADLHWMVGPWTGSLGPQQVAEDWSAPVGGTMSTMVRLTTAAETIMVELIVIRESDDTLVLHLRQFTPALEMVLSQDMPLTAWTSKRVAFQGPEGAGIKMLAYRKTGDGQMEVDVTVSDGTVLTAALRRP
jgi:uncharacterized protein DUF6265